MSWEGLSAGVAELFLEHNPLTPIERLEVRVGERRSWNWRLRLWAPPREPRRSMTRDERRRHGLRRRRRLHAIDRELRVRRRLAAAMREATGHRLGRSLVARLRRKLTHSPACVAGDRTYCHLCNR